MEIDMSAICEGCYQLIDQCPDCELFGNYYNEEDQMPKEDVGYTEIYRLPVTEKTSVIISKVFKDGKHVGYYINEFITTPRYTGPTKGAFVPGDKWTQLKAAINNL
jgi:hypothetical protein